MTGFLCQKFTKCYQKNNSVRTKSKSRNIRIKLQTIKDEEKNVSISPLPSLLRKDFLPSTSLSSEVAARPKAQAAVMSLVLKRWLGHGACNGFKEAQCAQKRNTPQSKWPIFFETIKIIKKGGTGWGTPPGRRRIKSHNN